MLRSRRLVLAVVFLGLLEQIRQRRDVRRESAPGQPGLDLLEEPAVPVGISKRGEVAVRATLGIRTRNDRSAEDVEVEDLADVGAVSDELGARAAWISETTRNRLCAEPGAAVVIPRPK